MRSTLWAALVATLALAPVAVAQTGDPSLDEQVYARLLADRLGVAPGRVDRVDHDGRARGVQVVLPGLVAERLRFRTQGEAEAWARANAGRGHVEVRGNQVLSLTGPRTADAESLARAREAGWDVLPAPAAAARVVGPPAGSRGGAPGAPASLGDAGRGRGRGGRDATPAGSEAAPQVQDAHGSAELLRHHLGGEALRGLAAGGPALQGREAVAAAVADIAPAVVGEHQRDRVLPAYDALSAEDRAAFDGLLAEYADQPAVRDQLLRGLASGNSIDDLAWLGGELDGKSPLWIRGNTRLTAPAREGPGVQQQFQDSCAATTVQALRGEYDPVYALRTRQANADVSTTPAEGSGNDPLSREQRTILEENGGVAVARGEVGGRGLGYEPWRAALNELGPQTGLEFEQVGEHTRPIEPDRAIDLMERNLEAGRAVPLAISNATGMGGHAVMATSTRRDADGQPEFLIYDPWDGRSTWVPAQRIRDQDLGVAGWDLITAVMVEPAPTPERPRLAPPPPMEPLQLREPVRPAPRPLEPATGG